MSSAKETFKELGFEQFHFENDENSITIGYKKEKPFVSVELINFYYYKTEKNVIPMVHFYMTFVFMLIGIFTIFKLLNMNL